MIVPPGAIVGAPAPAVAPGAAPVAGPVVAVGDELVWVRVESEGQKLRGEVVTLDGSEILHGDAGLKIENGQYFAVRRVKRQHAGKETSADARLLGLLGINFQGCPELNASGGTCLEKCIKRNSPIGLCQDLERLHGASNSSTTRMVGPPITTNGGPRLTG